MKITVQKIFLGLLLIYLAGFFGHALFLKKTVYGDGIYYFSWLHTLVIDRDLDFSNEYVHFGVSQPTTATGLIRNIYSIGPAILWMPAYLFAHNVLKGSGFEFGFQIIVGLSGVFYTVTALALVYRLLLRYFHKNISLLAVLGIALATNLLFYGSIDTVNSHALTFFAASLFLTFILDPYLAQPVAAGIVLGVIGLIRMQDLIYGIFLLPILTSRKIMYVFLGFIFALIPQQLIWLMFQGSLFTSPYFGERLLFFRPLQPSILEVLFSPVNGLFLWTPILLYAAMGLFIKKRKIGLMQWIMAAVVLLQVYVTSIRNEWWQEASFSGRMFVSVLPLLAFGLAQIFEIAKKSGVKESVILFSILTLSFMNGSLIIYYLLLH